MAETFSAGAVCTAGVLSLWKLVRQWSFKAVAHQESGKQRRHLAPPPLDLSDCYLPGCFEVDVAKASELRNQRSFLTLSSGENIFLQSWVPSSFKVKAVIVFIHGFGDHCDFQQSLKAKTVCSLGPFAAYAFDLPGHGRSDGLSAHVPDWFAFVDKVREVVVKHLRPRIKEEFGDVKVFGFGESMGGGVLFTLLVREKSLFDGAVLVCPMLFVSREMLPPWIVLMVFKHIGVRLLPTWPVAPGKDLLDLCFADPKMAHFMRDNAGGHSKIAYRGQPRLDTAFQLAFAAGEWMQSKIPEFETPALILHGAADRVTDPTVSKTLFDQMKHPDKEFLNPAGVWHCDLFHGGPTMYEGTRERFQHVARWLEKRSA